MQFTSYFIMWWLLFSILLGTFGTKYRVEPTSNVLFRDLYHITKVYNSWVIKEQCFYSHLLLACFPLSLCVVFSCWYIYFIAITVAFFVCNCSKYISRARVVTKWDVNVKRFYLKLKMGWSQSSAPNVDS